MQNIINILESVENKKLLAVFPHPDDECIAASGIIILAKKMGYEVTLITLTQGGAGKSRLNIPGKSLKEIRSDELKKSTSILGIDHLIIKDYEDGKLRQDDNWRRYLKNEILRINPGVVVTYDLTGITGHPDHVSVSVETKKIFSEMSGNPVFLWTTFLPGIFDFITLRLRKYRVTPTFVLSMGLKDVIVKMKSMQAHKSQKFEKKFFILLSMLINRKEWYHRIDPNRKYRYRYINYKI